MGKGPVPARKMVRDPAHIEEDSEVRMKFRRIGKWGNGNMKSEYI